MTDIIQPEHWSIQKAIRLVGEETISKLEEFYTKSSKLENEYKSHAQKLIAETLKLNQSGEVKKELTNLLLGLGFKKANVSKLIEATRFTNQLERDKSDAADWVKTLPVSTTYVLATCEDTTFSKIWSETSEWGSKPVTQKQIEQVKQKIEKPKSFRTETFTDKAPESFPTETFTDNTSTPFNPVNSNLLVDALETFKDYPLIIEAIQKTLDNESETIEQLS